MSQSTVTTKRAVYQLAVNSVSTRTNTPIMNAEQEQLIELGNQLLRLYCPDVICPVTHISKWTIRDSLIKGIDDKWSIGFENLPSEETFYRAFRSGKCSSAMREKLSLLYLAATVEEIGRKMNNALTEIAGRQRIQSCLYWNQFREIYASQTNTENTKPNTSRSTTGNRLTEEQKNLLEALKNQRAELHFNQAVIDELQKFEGELRFNEASKVLDSVQHNDQNILAWKYVNQGIYSELQNKFDEALSLYSRAISLQPQTAFFYHQLGTLQEFLGKYDEALQTQEKALSLNLKAHGLNHAETAVSHINIFSVWLSKGNIGKAEEHILTAYDILKKTKTDLSNEFIALYQNLGLFYQITGDFKKSVYYRRKAIKPTEELNGVFSDVTMKAYHNLGAVLSNLNEHDEALQWLQKALKVETKIYGTYHHATSQTLNSIGSIWHSKKEYNSALFCFKSSLEIAEKIFPYYHSETGLRYNNIGRTLIYLKKFKEAENAIQSALDIYKQTLASDSFRIGICYFNLSVLESERGKYKQAVKFCIEAITQYQKTLSENHPLIQAARKLLLQIQQH